MKKKSKDEGPISFLSKNFFYLAVGTLILTISTSQALNKRSKTFSGNKQLSKKESFFDVYKDRVLAAEYQLSAIPILRDGAEFPILSARNVVAADVESGVLLYEKNPTEVVLPASTTKIVTALVAFDVYPRDKEITVGDLSGVDGREMGLVKGEIITVENLLYGLLVHSANDAAYALADNYVGGYSEFIELMNEKAGELNLENTMFTNPAGYDQEGHYSTAKDMARAAAYAMKIPLFSKLVGTEEIVVESIEGEYKHALENTNELLGEVEGVLGTKTGWTQNANENLITYAERDSHKIVIAVLGSQDRFGETKELIEWIFRSYKWNEVETP